MFLPDPGVVFNLVMQKSRSDKKSCISFKGDRLTVKSVSANAEKSKRRVEVCGGGSTAGGASVPNKISKTQ